MLDKDKDIVLAYRLFRVLQATKFNLFEERIDINMKTGLARFQGVSLVIESKSLRTC